MRRKHKNRSFFRLKLEPLENRMLLSGTELPSDVDTTLLLHLNGNTTGAAGEIAIAQIGLNNSTGLIGQGVHVANPGTLQYSNAGNIVGPEGTVEFWFKPDWNGNTNTTYAFFETGDNLNNGMLLAIDGANNLRFIQWGDDPSVAGTQVDVERGVGASGTNIVAGNWYHLAATWKGATREMAFYLNGQQLGSINDGVQIANFSTSYLAIGSEVGAQSSARATFDEFRISSRARSAGEILDDYHLGLGIVSLSAPYGIAVDTTNRTFVSESGGNRVAIYNAVGSLLNKFGTFGSGNGQLNQPWGVANVGSSSIWVVDRGNHRVQNFSTAGSYLGQFGSLGTLPGQFLSPQGISIDAASGKIYVTDTGNHRVQRFLSNGTLDASWGTGGVVGTTGVLRRNHTGFDRPTAVAIHPLTGEIYVADYGNARLEVFNPSGTYLRTYLAQYRIQGLAFDAAGNLYAAGDDPNNSYSSADGRLRLLKVDDKLISASYSGGYDDLGRILGAVALRPDGRIVIVDTLAGRLVQTNSAFATPISDVSIDARGTTVTFRWKTSQPSTSTVRFGLTNIYGTVVADPTITTNHVVTLNGMTPNTRLYYGVSFADSFDGTERFTQQDVINTGAPTGQVQIQRIKAAGVIYTDAQPGAGYTSIDANLLAAAQTRFDRVADFYWRNSGFRLWLDIQVILVNRDITETILSVFGSIESDLASLGYSAADDFDALWGSSELSDGNFGGGGIAFGRSVGVAQLDTQDDFVAIHEVNHTIDSIFYENELHKYEFNHGIWAVPGGVGTGFSINGQILRNILPANFGALKAPYTKKVNAVDIDGDGLPDTSPAGLLHPLSITEATLGSSAVLADSDNDGVSDRAEAMALPYHQTNLNAIDSDGDGISDSKDANPAYAIQDKVQKGSPVIDGSISVGEKWTLLTDGWGFNNTGLVSDNNLFQATTRTYAAWDDNYLYLALRGPTSSTQVQLDGGADNWFAGTDNYELNLDNSSFFRSVRVNVGAPDVFRQIDDDGQFSEFFDTDPQFVRPYNGRAFFNRPTEGLGFAGRLVTENDLLYQLGGSGASKVWEVAIPWSHETGLRGFDGKEMAITFDVSGDRIFSVDHAAKIQLVDPKVVNRQVFYNNATGFGTSGVNNAPTLNPLNAIDPSKFALLPGQTTTLSTLVLGGQNASSAHFTNYSRGLNGIVVDLNGTTNLASINASSFQFATWSSFPDATPNFVTVNPTVMVSTFAGGGVGGSDRIKLVFDDNAIQESWLRITVLANASTGLVTNDVFYFGNARGDVTPNTSFPSQISLNALDLNQARNNQLTSGAVVSNLYDVDKNGAVNSLDLNQIRARQGTNSLRSFTAPPPGMMMSLASSSIDSAFADTSWLEAFQVGNTKNRQQRRG
jgi:Concanavalin A-like lectin/glucanases superfamily/NHL repeat